MFEHHSLAVGELVIFLIEELFDEGATAFGEGFVILFACVGAHGFAIVCCVACLHFFSVELFQVGLKLRLLIGCENVPDFDEVGFWGGFAGIDFAEAILRPLDFGGHFEIGVTVAFFFLRTCALIDGCFVGLFFAICGGSGGGSGLVELCAEFVDFILMLFVVLTGIGLESLVDGFQVFFLGLGEVDFVEDTAVNAEVGFWAVVASAT